MPVIAIFPSRRRNCEMVEKPLAHPTSRTRVPSLIYCAMVSISSSTAKLSPHEAQCEASYFLAFSSQCCLMNRWSKPFSFVLAAAAPGWSKHRPHRSIARGSRAGLAVDGISGHQVTCSLSCEPPMPLIVTAVKHRRTGFDLVPDMVERSILLGTLANSCLKKL